MVDIKAYPYLCFVSFDLVEKEFDRQFNLHFDDHIQELADRPGSSTTWRTRELRGADNKGVMEQEYQQIYAINDPGLFKSFPQDPPPPVMESEPWRRDIIRNWGRVFYRVLSLREKDARAGRRPEWLPRFLPAHSAQKLTLGSFACPSSIGKRMGTTSAMAVCSARVP
jgi:hypothetical protein